MHQTSSNASTLILKKLVNGFKNFLWHILNKMFRVIFFKKIHF